MTGRGRPIAVVPIRARGPGWINQIVLIIRERPDGSMTQEILQSRQWAEIPDLAALFEVGRQCQEDLIAAVLRAESD